MRRAELGKQDGFQRNRRSRSLRSLSQRQRCKEQEGKKYEDYFDFSEGVKTLPSHRVLALRRGETEGFLRVRLEVDREASVGQIEHRVIREPAAPLVGELRTAIGDAYDRLLSPSIEVDVRLSLK